VYHVLENERINEKWNVEYFLDTRFIFVVSKRMEVPMLLFSEMKKIKGQSHRNHSSKFSPGNFYLAYFEHFLFTRASKLHIRQFACDNSIFALPAICKLVAMCNSEI